MAVIPSEEPGAGGRLRGRRGPWVCTEGSREAAGCKGTLGPTDTWFLCPCPRPSQASVTPASILGGRDPLSGSSLCPGDVLPGCSLPALLAWHRGPS